MLEQKTEWIKTDSALPETDDAVLVISKFNHISSASYSNYGFDKYPKRFRPYGYLPGTDVSWWLPIPSDGWKDFELEKPDKEGFYLTKESYGSIVSQEWKHSLLSGRNEFFPLGAGFNMGKLKYWRETPPLPKGVILK